MEFYEVVAGRRSVRKYSEDRIPEEVVERLVRAAQWAPSWAHTQCCEVVLATRPEVKEALQKTLPPSNPAYKAMAAAPLVAAFCGRSGKAGFYKGQAATVRGDWMMFDVALAMQNFMLAAAAEGLGTVCVGLFDAPAAAAALPAPAGLEVVALTPVGYPAADTRVPPRKGLEEFVHRESF